MTIDDNVSFGKISNTDINGRCITPADPLTLYSGIKSEWDSFLQSACL